MLTQKQKKELVEKLSENIEKSQTTVICDYKGMTVPEISELRNELRKDSALMQVAKKTLIKKGLKDAKVLGDNELDLEGSVAVAVGYDDEVAPARLSNEYSKTNKNLKLLGGFIATKYMDAKEIKALALLPGKDQLRAQLVGTINAPVSGFVNVLAGNIRGLVNVLKAVGEKK